MVCARMEEASVCRPFHEEGPDAKRHKSENPFYEPEASDCYEYRSSVLGNDDEHSAMVPFQQSWLTDLEPFMTNNDEDDGSDVPLDEVMIQNRKDHVEQLRRQLLQYKERMEGYSDGDFRYARRFCNPYEALDDTNLFLNRSALKLANIDALLNFRLSKQIDQEHSDSEQDQYFVDLCGAPGGFGEYLVWRGASRGFGMSLIGHNESGRGLYWNREIVKLQGKGNQTCYVIHIGTDGTGDVQNWENVVSLQNRILESNVTTKDGAQIVLADGGVDAQRNAEDQELVTTKLFVCQTAAALFLLRMGGTLLIKGFGFQSATTRAIVAFFACNFEAVNVIKPITSRPASAERYIVAEGYNGTPIKGPSWISQMLLANHDAVPSDIGAFLDYKDEALLLLNGKACADIMTKLNQTKGTESDSSADDEDESCLPLFTFKIKWQLQ